MALVTKYVVITPVRDEEAHIQFTIDSMATQSLRPIEWVIVNDGSSDKTGTILDDAARKHSWLHAVHRANRGFRKAGTGVIEAFNDGYRSLRSRDWEFVAKLDGDLSFKSTYFEKCLKHFLDDRTLGIAGGSICNRIAGGLKPENCPRFHVRGATKIYRRACWEDLGGLLVAPGWDTLDEVKAHMKGWRTQTFPELTVIQYRPTGAADGHWKNLVKNGVANYMCGYHPLFMAVKCASRLIRRPYVMGSAALAYGFLGGYLRNLPRVDDSELIQYLRAQQMRRLLGGRTIWR